MSSQRYRISSRSIIVPRRPKLRQNNTAQKDIESREITIKHSLWRPQPCRHDRPRRCAESLTNGRPAGSAWVAARRQPKVGSPPLGFVMTANGPSTTQNLDAQSRRKRDCERKMGGCRHCIIRFGYTKPRKFLWKESRPSLLPQWNSCN